MSIAGLSIDDPFATELRMHPSDWDRGADGREKLRERREEIIRAFDSALAGFGRSPDLVAERLSYIAAVALSAGVGLGLDVTAHLSGEPDADRRRLGEAVPTDYLHGPDGMMAVCVGQLGARLSFVTYGESVGHGEASSDRWDEARRDWFDDQGGED